jgi:hypothetical protein
MRLESILVRHSGSNISIVIALIFRDLFVVALLRFNMGWRWLDIFVACG